jgi:hypothetical protein
LFARQKFHVNNCGSLKIILFNTCKKGEVKGNHRRGRQKFEIGVEIGDGNGNWQKYI